MEEGNRKYKKKERHIIPIVMPLPAGMLRLSSEGQLALQFSKVELIDPQPFPTKACIHQQAAIAT